ncbi:MAG: Calx-beta domain-containing protein, partial [Thermodesulfovibrionales bacterium]
MGTPTNATASGTTVHTATITDDDATPTVQWTAASQASVNETGSMTVTAQLSAVSGQNVTIPFTVTGTATGGTDYTITASPITINAGSTTATATITITGDAINEGNETVILTMGTPTNATASGTTVHTATITDDDTTVTVQWTAANQASVNESGSMTVTAQLSAASGQTVTVPFTVTGTATNVTDYDITASPITIAPGNTTGTAIISVNVDIDPEANETVILTMGTPTNANLGSTTVHTATITDDDMPTVQFTAASQTSANETGTMTVTALLSAASTVTVTVPFTVSGSATDVTDYTITASPITITPGNTTGTATITIAADTVDEPNETVILTMGTPTNATSSGITVHTATITDDDFAGISILNAWPAAFTQSATTGNPVAANFTVNAGSDRLLVVAIDCYDSGGAVGQTFNVTYGGTPLTQAVIQNNNRRQSWIGYLALDTSGTNTTQSLAVTVTGTHTNVGVYAASYSGVSQAAPITGFSSIYGNNTAAAYQFPVAVNVNAGGYGIYTWGGSTTRSSDTDTPVATSYTEHSDVLNGLQMGVASKAFATTTTTRPTVTYAATARVSQSLVTLNPGASDTTPPSVTINQAIGQADPTNVSPINFTVVFSENTTNFATGDVTITGTAGGTKTATVTGSGASYNVAVTGMTTPGTVIASINAGVATDAAGNGNTASTTTDATVNLDATGPSGLSTVSPVNGATGLPLNTTVNSSTATDTNGPVQYYFQVAQNTGFTVGVQNSGWQAGTSFAPVLANNLTYYWHVKARDALGNETAYTGTQSFSTVAVCIRSVPDVNLTPTNLNITSDGGTAVFALQVLNNDTLTCSSSTFNLAKVDSNTTNFDASLLSAASVTLAPGASSAGLTLTVRAKLSEISGQNFAYVTATDATNHAAQPGTSNTTTTTLNVVQCTANAPLLLIAPDSENVNIGSSQIYTISVRNNDTGAGCPAVTYNINIVSETNAVDFDPSTRNPVSLVLGAGQSGTSA